LLSGYGKIIVARAVAGDEPEDIGGKVTHRTIYVTIIRASRRLPSAA